MRLMFQPRSEPGGHSIPDRNNFNLSALGRIWVPATDGGADVPDMSTVSTVPRIDGTGPSTQPCALIDFSETANFTYAAGDASNAYNYVSTSSTTSPIQSFTYDQMLYQPAIFPWASGLGWGSLPNWYSGVYSPSYQTKNIGVQKAFRTSALIRGGTGGQNYVVVVDDIQKDNSAHNYIDRVMLASDLTNITYSGSTDAIITSSTGGNVSMLIRILRCNGTPAMVENNPGNLNCLDISLNTVSPNLVVLLLPYTNGHAFACHSNDPEMWFMSRGLPDRWIMLPLPNSDGRTRLSFARPSASQPAPVITVPSDIVTTATATPGNVVNSGDYGSDSVDSVVPVTSAPPSRSITLSVHQNGCLHGNRFEPQTLTEATFTVTVMPVSRAPNRRRPYAGPRANHGDMEYRMAASTSLHQSRDIAKRPLYPIPSGVTDKVIQITA